MFILKVENTLNQIVTLTQNESAYQIIGIDGLNPPQAVINSSVVAGMDGSKFNSSRLAERNIVITIRLNGNVRENRLFLYRYFRSKQWCKLYYNNDLRNVYIEGYVETIEVDHFSQSETMQISIICQNPYFKSLNEIVNDISKSLAAFEFPFAIGDGIGTDDPVEISTVDMNKVAQIVNNSEIETGLIIELTFTGQATNPIIREVLRDNSFFGIKGTFTTGDKIVIDTNQGNKKITLYHNGVASNIFNQIVKGSTWFKLAIGDNQYQYTADEGSEVTFIKFKHYNLYEGV